MARTGLFADLRLAMRMAAQARRAGAPPIDEMADPSFLRLERAKVSRRGLLGGALGAGLMAALPRNALARSDARIAVVGGGLAGLVAAHRLVQGGARNVTVYEANKRIGGRMLTGRNVLTADSYVELGGSFINTEHEDMLALCREFGLGLEDGAAGEDAQLAATYFVDGAHRSLREIADASRDLARRIDEMQKLGEAAEAQHDAMSAAQVLDQAGVSGWLRKLIDIGLTQEMGLEPDRMSALYIIDTFSPDPAQPKRGLFHSDQRFQVIGGNDRLPRAIAAKLGSRVRMGHRLEAIRRRGARYALSFATDAGAREIVADIVVIALPPTVLRDVRLDIGLGPVTQRAIRETTLGTNAKLFAGVSSRPWRATGRSGECLNDLGFQTVWEDHGVGGTGPGGFTIFAGGRTGEDFARGTAVARAREITQRLDVALPGAAAAFTGRASRMHWPSSPFVRGSYSCFAPGQMTAFGDAFEPVDGVVFAGEHLSEDHSGYMNGAAESGRIAAETAAKLLAA
jgi:monoamine oxidase